MRNDEGKIMRILFILCSACVIVSAQPDSQAHELAGQERAFSAAADSFGINRSFVMFLDEQCVMFNPHPVNGMQLYRTRPESKAHLSWYPAFVEVAASGDLGLSTGPWQYRTTKGDTPVAYGYYISVWKKQADGVWKVIFDNGVGYPKHLHRSEPEKFNVLPSPAPRNTPATASRTMMDAERAFVNVRRSRGAAAAVGEYGDENVRVYRNEAFPAVNKDLSRSLLRSAEQGMRYTPFDSVIAASGDLGYVYGIAVSPAKDSASYVRIWRYRSGWKLAADVLDPFRKP